MYANDHMVQYRTVLIIEDSETDRYVFRRYLLADSEISYTILESSSATEALTLCQTQLPDGILLDVKLPDFDGFEFLTRLKAQTQGACPPVIVVSHYNDAVTAATAFKNGAEDYFVKGQTSPDDVRLAMRSAIENSDLRCKLQQSEERFRTSIENLLDCFGICSAIRNDTEQIIDFRIDYLNRVALDSNCFTERTIGKLLSEIFPRYRDSGMFAEHCSLVETGEPLIKEAFVDSDLFSHETLPRIYDVRSSKLGDGFVSAWREVTERVRVEQELRQSEERWQLALQGNHDGIWDHDLRTDCHFLSDRCLEMLGYTLDELRCFRQLLSYVHPDDLARLQTCWQQHLTQETEHYSCEYRVRCKDGNYKWFLSRGRALWDAAGNPIRAVGSLSDITERKQAEVEREQLLSQAEASRAEAEAANQSKDVFLAIVAHELRAPLNSMFGWTQLLQKKASDPTTLSRALSSIERSAKNQMQLIEDLLDISRMVQGNLRIERVPTNLAFVVEAAMDMIRPLADAKQIQIESNINHAANKVLADSNRLQQIVWNLLTNAIKFTPEQGRVEVTLTYSELQAEIRVSDTGKGIRAGFLPFVFDRFRQAQSNAPKSHDGLGLGLAITRELVNLHEGTITVASLGEGQGATFTVRLPLLDRSPPTSQDSQDLNGLKVLVVDDEVDSLEFVRFFLEDQGAIVATATSATEAIEQLQDFRPVVLISDIAMPNKNGYDLLREIRALPAGQSIVAIALTAHVDEEVKQRAFAAGYRIHLSKPLDTEQLLEAIAALIKA